MTALKLNIIIVCLFISSINISIAKSNVTYEKGWTNKRYNSFLNACVRSAVSKNMEHLVKTKILERDTPKYLTIYKEVTRFHTSVCDCTQLQIMSNYEYTEISKMMQIKNYVRDLALSCHKKVLAKKNKQN